MTLLWVALEDASRSCDFSACQIWARCNNPGNYGNWLSQHLLRQPSRVLVSLRENVEEGVWQSQLRTAQTVRLEDDLCGGGPVAVSYD